MAGTLEGLQGVRAWQRTCASSRTRWRARNTHRQPSDSTAICEAGFDVKYGVTSGLTWDFTVNTDFSQVEADEQQVNLTRFSLFFPEKRDFFLENSGVFQFGVGGQTAGGGRRRRRRRRRTQQHASQRHDPVLQPHASGSRRAATRSRFWPARG